MVAESSVVHHDESSEAKLVKDHWAGLLKYCPSLFDYSLRMVHKLNLGVYWFREELRGVYIVFD